MELIITDKEAIRKALSMNIPDSFLPNELKAIGTRKYKGDGLPGAWSADPHFTIGKAYYQYYDEGHFMIGNDGKGYKIVPAAWSKIKYL